MMKVTIPSYTFIQFKNNQFQNDEERVRLFNTFIQILDDMSNLREHMWSEITHLTSYILPYLDDNNNNERDPVLKYFVGYNTLYNTNTCGKILESCTQEQRNNIIIAKNCIPDVIFHAYSEAKKAYENSLESGTCYDVFIENLEQNPDFEDKAIKEPSETELNKVKLILKDQYINCKSEAFYKCFIEALKQDYIFKDVIADISEETLQSALQEIETVCKERWLDPDLMQQIQNSQNWQITIGSITDYIILATQESYVNFVMSTKHQQIQK